MTNQQKLTSFPYQSLVAAITAALTLTSGTAHAVGQSDLGRAVQSLGGSTFQVRAADAIYVTCVGLALNDSNTTDQAALGGRCADMSQQGISLANTPGTVVPGSDTFGLGRLGANGVQQYSGEEASSQGRYATEGSASQFKSLASRLSAIRRGARSSGLAFNLQGVDVLSVADSDSQGSGNRALIGGAASDSDADLGWAWFGNVEYGFGDRDSSSNENAYDAD